MSSFGQTRKRFLKTKTERTKKLKNENMLKDGKSKPSKIISYRKLEYCFTREREIAFTQQKKTKNKKKTKKQKNQIVPMSNDFVEITIFLCLIYFYIYGKYKYSEMSVFFKNFIQKFKMAAKNGAKTIFWKNCKLTVDTLGIKNFIKITLSRNISEINAFLHFTQKFKMATKKY